MKIFFQGVCQHQQDHPKTQIIFVAILAQKPCKGIICTQYNGGC